MPYQTIDDVVNGLAALESEFRARRDRRSIFLTLYGIVSSEMRARVAAGAFADPEWVHRYAVAFANLYREALEAYDGRRLADVPKSWRLAFDAALAGESLVLQDVLLGVNAHVNNDLALALDRVSIGPDRERRRRDHNAVNEVLSAVTERAVQRLAALYAPGFTTMDECAGELDEMASLFSLQIGRDSAWEAAVSLANARGPIERTLTTRLLSTRAAAMSRLLLAPSRNAHFITACRRLEAGGGWLTTLSSLKEEVRAAR